MTTGRRREMKNWPRKTQFASDERGRRFSFAADGPNSGGRVLVRLPIGFEEDCKIVETKKEEPLGKQLSRYFGDVLIFLEPSGPGRMS